MQNQKRKVSPKKKGVKKNTVFSEPVKKRNAVLSFLQKINDFAASNKKSILIAVSSALIIITSLAASGNAFFLKIMMRVYQTIHAPLRGMILFDNFSLDFPDYFFLNIIIAAAFSFLLFNLLKGEDVGRSTKKRDVISIVLAWLAFIIYFGIFKLNKGDAHHFTQMFLFIAAGAAIIYMSIRDDAGNNIKISESGMFVRWELPGLLLFSGVLFVVYTFDMFSWKYAFIGDEYSFLEYAVYLKNGDAPLRFFSERGVLDYHPVLSSIWQSLLLVLFKNDFMGWKVSSAIIAPLAVIPLYIWMKMVFDRKSAVITAAAFGFGQGMLAFSHIGYNNIQSILPFTLVLLAMEFAMNKNSRTWTVITALVLGLGCYTFYTSRLLIIVAGLYWLFHPQRKSFSKKNLFLGLFIYALMVSFLVFDSKFIHNLLQQTAVNSEIPDASERLYFIFINYIYSLLAFVRDPVSSHFIAGSLNDPVTVIGVVAGLTWCVMYFAKDWRARFVLVSYVVLAFFIGAIVKYRTPTNTRLFWMAGMLAILAGIGWPLLLSAITGLRKPVKLNGILTVTIMFLIIASGSYRFYKVMPGNHYFTIQAYVVKYIQEDSDGRECYIVADTINMMDRILEYYKLDKKAKVISTTEFEKMLNEDSLKGRTLIRIYENPPTVAEREFVKKGKVYLDYRDFPVLYAYDFSDETYYEAFKQLHKTGETEFEIEAQEQIADSEKFVNIETKPVIEVMSSFSVCPPAVIDDPVLIDGFKIQHVEISGASMSVPSDMAVSKNGNEIFIADGAAGKVFILNKNAPGRYRNVRTVSITGSIARKTTEQAYIALDEKERVFYILDSLEGKILRCNTDGTSVKTIAESELLVGGRCLRFDLERNNMTVANPGSNMIIVVDKKGRVVRTYATKRGKGCGQMNQPSFFITGRDSYVLDSSNFRMQIFDDKFKFKKQIGIGPITTVMGPQVLLREDKGIAIVAMPDASRITFHYLDGKKTRTMQFIDVQGLHIFGPTSIGMDSKNLIYALDGKLKKLIIITLPEGVL